MTPGDVILTRLPQSNGIWKLRPALVLCTLPRFNDLLLCGITTQTRHFVEDFDEIIRADDADFVASGLKAESLIRLGFLGTVPRSDVVGTIGSIAPDRKIRLIRKLVEHLERTL